MNTSLNFQSSIVMREALYMDINAVAVDVFTASSARKATRHKENDLFHIYTVKARSYCGENWHANVRI